MDSDTTHPLSPAEAKARLRAAAQAISMKTLMRGNTWRVLGLALAGGLVIGRLPGSLLLKFAPMLVMAMLRKCKAGKCP